MEEKKYCYKYPHPAITADSVVFAKENNETFVLLIQRKEEPYKGCWAFPGGFMNIYEEAEICAKRELFEETGIKIKEKFFQIGAFTKVDRDPRERVITVAFMTLTKMQEVHGGDDAAIAKWFNIKQMPALAFDHADIFKKAIKML